MAHRRSFVWFPCAICTSTKVKVTNGERICGECKEQWRAELDSPWVKGAIEIMEEQYNQERRHRHEVPLEGWEGLTTKKWEREFPYISQKHMKDETWLGR